MARITITIALLMLVPVPEAAADSDGYFCTARGYLAYETRLSGTAGHQLHVVRFSGDTGIQAAPSVRLDEFQVHGMVCHPERVEIVAWKQTYSVDIASPEPKVTVRPAPFTADARIPNANLGHWAKELAIDLDAAAAPGEFELVIARASREVRGGIEHHTVTRIIRRDTRLFGGRIIESLLLFEGVFRETVD